MNPHTLWIPIAALLAGVAAPALGAQPRRIPTEAVTDRLIVKYKTSVDTGGTGFPTAAAAAAVQVAGNRHGVAVTPLRRSALGAQVMSLNRAMSLGDLRTMAASLMAGDPNVEYAEPDRPLYPLAVPNDPMYSVQWHWSDATGGVRAPAAWDVSTGSGVTVAVIDTGVRPHADLAANLLSGYDFISSAATAGDGDGRDSDASDNGDAVSANACYSGSPASNSSWHGTHVAGIIAAVANNSAGVAGLAYNAKILPVRVLGKCGGYTSDIADAIVWAAGGSVSGAPANATPAKVLNLSLGGSGSCDSTTQAAIDSARSRGAVVVVAAGNESSNASAYTPASCSGVITVAATSIGGGRASYSNYGAVVEIAAPGGDSGNTILSTYNSGSSSPGADSYQGEMGTSMATPVVSAAAALVLSVNSALTPDQVATMLTSTARAFPASCSGCGVGIVDAAAAAQAAYASVTPTPITVSEAEANDTLGTAQAIASVPATINGSIGSGTDNDYYRIAVPAGRTLSLSLAGAAGTGPGYAVYTALGRRLVERSGSVGATLTWSVVNHGSGPLTLYVRVKRSAGSTGNYTLTLGI